MISNANIIVTVDQYAGLKHIVRYKGPCLLLAHDFKMLKEGVGKVKVG